MMPLSPNTKTTLASLIIVLGLFVSVNTANAVEDEKVVVSVTEKETCVSAYGEPETCTSEKYEDTVTHARTGEVHGTVDAGLEDVNFIGIAAIMGAVGAVFSGISKLTSKVYLLD